MSLFEEMDKGYESAVRAATWAHYNWDSFARVMNYAEGQASQGNPRLTRSDVLSECRRGGIRLSDGGEFARDHNLYQPLARYMVMMRPALGKVLHFQDADCDMADMAGIWRDVNPTHPLAVSSWRDA